jgi:GAF domain-containing protein
MTALSQDVLADLNRLVAELEQRLDSSFAAHDEAIAQRALTAQENARLRAELAIARDRQSASAEILHTIASASGDAERALLQIAETSARLFGAPSATIQIAEGDGWAKTIRFGASSKNIGAGVPESRLRIGGRNMPGVIVAENRQVHVPDLDNVDPAIADWPGLPFAREAGTRSMSGSPLRREGNAIGALIVYRDRLAPFTAEELAVQQTFADQAAIAIENARLFNEVQDRTSDLSESLRQQTAVGDVLKTISRSTFDLQPVLDTLVQTAARLCDAEMAFILRREGDVYRAGAAVGFSREYIAFLQQNAIVPNRGTVTGRVALEHRTVQIIDVATDPEYTMTESVTLANQHTALGVPLLRENEPIGVIVLARQRVEAFTPKQIELVTTFADQAVIAIENVRLFDQLRHRTDDLSESLQQQTATSEVLKVISRSAFDLDSVLATLVESAATLCEAERGMIFLRRDDYYHMSANYGFSPELEAFARAHPFAVDSGSTTARAAISGIAVQAVDLLADETQGELAREYQRLGGHRTNLGVPLRRKGETIGVFTLTRQTVRPFTDKQIEIVSTFADQAVIAIENVRLFDEVQAKTRDLSEALTYQTGSSNILRVIASSPTDVEPVLQAIVESACELCEANDAVVLLKDGDDLRFRAHYGPIAINLDKWPIGRGWTAGRAFLDKEPVHVRDVMADEGTEFPDSRELSRHTGSPGVRSILSVPLLRENESIGSILLRRTEVLPFSAKQIALLQTFANQAVIAIGNVSLFDEVQAKTRDLSEALTYQTGSSNILSVIASSPTNVEPVLKAIVQSACKVCSAYDAAVLLKDGDDLRFNAHHGPIPIGLEKWPINRHWTAGRAVLEKRPVHLHDLLAEENADFSDGREMSQRMGHRSILSVPLMRESEAIGAIVLRRTEVHPFSDKQIALLQTFADQAVIAIGNVNLFEQVQARTEDLRESLEFQTATSDVLKVISSSPDSLQPVLDVIVETSRHLCGTETSTIFLLNNGRFHIAAASGAMPEYLEFLRSNPIAISQPGSSTARAAREKRTVHIPDIGADPEFGQGPMSVGERRALLSVPLMREDIAIGVITMRQTHLRPFNERQIEVVRTFADQAVIAISNVRLFEEVQERTKELSKSLDDLRTAQDRLVQTEKLASLGQLTAGIAHEIKNPLNFINNFSALSAELTDELNDVLRTAALDDKVREDVNELTGLLKDNLEKVVAHGKRADSIVKNMLLHSREGSGDHRPTDINALVDESLNLAYHGARAEKPQFNVTLQRDFDPDAGTAELFPQEITRVLLNLISNGFYAVSKRKAETTDSGFEPLLSAATRNLGDTVEIRIRDNGTGIPAEVKDKMFNPFFTTKPAGEGTGLGLSMSHDIIVKQHSGTIEVETAPGQFTEFRIVLPRKSSIPDRSGGQT